MALSVKLTDISWESVRMISVDGRALEIVTDRGTVLFRFPDADKLSEALLILALQGTRKVEFVDDARFNPALILDSELQPAGART